MVIDIYACPQIVHVQDLKVQFDEGALGLLVDLMSKTYPVETMQSILLLINTVTNAPEVMVRMRIESNRLLCITVALMERYKILCILSYNVSSVFSFLLSYV